MSKLLKFGVLLFLTGCTTVREKEAAHYFQADQAPASFAVIRQVVQIYPQLDAEARDKLLDAMIVYELRLTAMHELFHGKGGRVDGGVLVLTRCPASCCEPSYDCGDCCKPGRCACHDPNPGETCR